MREIFISFSVFICCLLIALVSQIVSPSSISAASPQQTLQVDVISVENSSNSQTNFELDPEDPNPSLFKMASNRTKADASPLGGPLDAATPKITESGLSITDLVVGDGPEASAGKTVSVNYRGTLENGKEFDSSYGRGAFDFPLGAGRVIKGWDEGVAGMKVGGKRKLIIPSELGYGSRGAGNVIPPNATLIFEVELLDII